jgi:hypothetical protein
LSEPSNPALNPASRADAPRVELRRVRLIPREPANASYLSTEVVGTLKPEIDQGLSATARVVVYPTVLRAADTA